MGRPYLINILLAESRGELLKDEAKHLRCMDNSVERSREVNRAALLSLIAALGLTIIKVVVGVISGSLGVISEALHSALDLAAAGITFVSVRRAARIPDEEHHYGHGKIENFSAFIQTILLWITAAWILFEAVRVISLQEFPDPTLAGVIVMIVSIIVNVERSRVLYATAEKHGSQALEADGLHFVTDAMSSIVVLVGLLFVFLDFPIADPLSAIGVAIVILFVSAKLSKRAADALLDRAPRGIDEEVKRICLSTPGVLECRRTRVRESGHQMFLDVVIAVEKGTSVDEAHHIADALEQALRRLNHNVDCVVHVEPISIDDAIQEEVDVYALLHMLARKEPRILGVHKVRITMTESHTYIAADLEMPSDMTVEQAHEITDQMEERLSEAIPNLQRVTLHIDVERREHGASYAMTNRKEMISEIKEIVERVSDAHDCHGVVVTEGSSGLIVSLDCYVSATMSLGESHDIAESVENLVKQRFPEVELVYVHAEPK
ncbi:MAG: cation-efflux pump [Candidatus Thorarchaeota archaeon]|nr:cation-efflux pump [Candidatus Thorarchaeota archaeon]